MRRRRGQNAVLRVARSDLRLPIASTVVATAAATPIARSADGATLVLPEVEDVVVVVELELDELVVGKVVDVVDAVEEVVEELGVDEVVVIVVVEELD
jgi:hypothetical protein